MRILADRNFTLFNNDGHETYILCGRTGEMNSSSILLAAEADV